MSEAEQEVSGTRGSNKGVRNVRESAAEIAHRFKLADLVRARMCARRLYLNALVRKASRAHYECSLDPDFTLDLDDAPLPYTRYFLDMTDDDLVMSRRGVPGYAPRLLHNRRLAELEAARLESTDQANRLVARYLQPPKPKPAIEEKSNAAEANEEEQNKDDGNGHDDDDSLLEEMDAAYLDLLSPSYDAAADLYPRVYSRRARALLRRSPYRRPFRPLSVTTRLMERRLQN